MRDAIEGGSAANYNKAKKIKKNSVGSIRVCSFINPNIWTIFSVNLQELLNFDFKKKGILTVLN